MLDCMYFAPSDKTISKIVVDRDSVNKVKTPQIIKKNLAELA